jgi:hypothetical protein
MCFLFLFCIIKIKCLCDVGTFQVRCDSFRDLVSVIWRVAESASQRLIMGPNGQVQTHTDRPSELIYRSSGGLQN